MYILLATSILCFLALVLATVAISRHVRTHQVTAGPRRDFVQHLFAAANDQDSFTPRQQSNVEDIFATTSWNNDLEPALPNPRKQSISSKRL